MAKPHKKQSPAAQAQYAPRVRTPSVAVVPRELDPTLMPLVRSALDALKLPGAIPSDVLLALAGAAKAQGAASVRPTKPEVRPMRAKPGITLR